MKRNLVFVVLLAAIQPSRRFHYRRSEQNCRRLSRNQALVALELTLCTDCRQRDSSGLYHKLRAVSAATILRRTHTILAARSRGCAIGPHVPVRRPNPPLPRAFRHLDDRARQEDLRNPQTTKSGFGGRLSGGQSVQPAVLH